MTAIFMRSRLRKPPDGPSLVPDSWWDQFPPDTAIVKKLTPHSKPLITTWPQLGERKRARQAEILAHRRGDSYRSERRPLYVWVFYCPGFVYEGWWTYLIGRGISYGRYLSRNERLVSRLMELFPMGEPTLYGPSLTYEQWMPRFARRYCCRWPDGKPRTHAGRIQGKAFVWAEVQGDQVRWILGPVTNRK